MVLLEELVEEVLLRLPPAEPASLVRAALVCKPWCRLISGRRFRHRFGELHRSPPVLGYFCNKFFFTDSVTCFVPASPAFPPRADQVLCHALDARHGRVLLRRKPQSPRLTVWDPVAGDRWELPPLSDAWNKRRWNAAVLCAASAASAGACDHLDCREKPFLVVCVGSGRRKIYLCIYSSETGSWTEPTFAAWTPGNENGVFDMAPALVGNSLYFMVDVAFGMLRYDLVTRETSMIDSLPVQPMKLVDGGIAVAIEDYCRLSLWSMEMSPNGDIKWAQLRVIDLNKVLPAGVLLEDACYVAYARGVGILAGTIGRLLNIDLESDKVKTLYKGGFFHGIIPYTSFYIPVLGSVAAVEEPRPDASVA
ncbi:unnamed protein product [Urochloa decumbens]|uniref:F-box domain-containing protein n=1 Tax=Urochloa decumbens TaxID=240449 RepID=A0ABC9G7I1_9POAL